MDVSTFHGIKEAVHRMSFKAQKLDALRSATSATYACYSPDQVAELLKEFPFDDDKVEAVKICATKMYPTTCSQAVTIIRPFSFADRKVKAIEAMASIITDPASHYVFDEVLSFDSDRSKARDMLMNRAVGPPSQCHYHHTQHASENQDLPPGRPGCPPVPYGYGPTPGYGPIQGYGPTPGYGPIQGYGPTPGYGPIQGYGPTPGYGPISGYGPTPGNGPYPGSPYPTPGNTAIERAFSAAAQATLNAAVDPSVHPPPEMYGHHPGYSGPGGPAYPQLGYPPAPF